jgi:uncharacterized membrane protein
MSVNVLVQAVAWEDVRADSGSSDDAQIGTAVYHHFHYPHVQFHVFIAGIYYARLTESWNIDISVVRHFRNFIKRFTVSVSDISISCVTSILGLVLVSLDAT